MVYIWTQKREKRRGLFRKPTVHVQQCEARTVTVGATAPVNPVLDAEQRHVIAVAAATAAAAEVAVATAQAAEEIVRLTRPNNFAREHYAATLIQTAFRGYLVSNLPRACLRLHSRLKSFINNKYNFDCVE